MFQGAYLSFMRNSGIKRGTKFGLRQVMDKAEGIGRTLWNNAQRTGNKVGERRSKLRTFDSMFNYLRGKFELDKIPMQQYRWVVVWECWWWYRVHRNTVCIPQYHCVRLVLIITGQIMFQLRGPNRCWYRKFTCFWSLAVTGKVWWLVSLIAALTGGTVWQADLMG